MKAYTDIEQSKKLAEILPIESADGYWFKGFPPQPYMVYTKDTPNLGEHIACWSLAVLLEIIGKPTAFDLLINGRGCRCHCTDKHEGKFYGTDDYCDTPIDACVKIIEKLHKQKLL